MTVFADVDTRKLPLADCVEFLDNLRKPITQEDREPGPYPYYGANGQQDSVAEFIFDEELLLLAEDGGHFGSADKDIAYLVSGKCWVNNHAHVLRAKPGTELRYLYHAIRKFDVLPFISGSTRGKLTKGAAERIPILLPTIPEQRRIADILDRADTLKRKRQQALKLADDFLRATFLDMFGDPATNPKNWTVRRLDAVGTLDRGKSKHRPRNDPRLLNGPYPLIQTGDVAKSDGYIKSYSQSYSEIGLGQSRMWPKGTLCVTIAANIAKTSILTFDACFPDSVVGFTPNDSIVSSRYVKKWLEFLQKRLEDGAPQSAQKNINLEILRKQEIPVPPFELQREYEAIESHLFRYCEKSTTEHRVLAELITSIQNRIFSKEASH